MLYCSSKYDNTIAAKYNSICNREEICAEAQASVIFFLRFKTVVSVIRLDRIECYVQKIELKKPTKTSTIYTTLRCAGFSYLFSIREAAYTSFDRANNLHRGGSDAIHIA